MTVTPTFEQTGSIGADSVRSQLVGVESSVEITSEAAEAEVARLVETAERMCFMVDAIRNSRPLEMKVSLNGSRLSLEDQRS